MYPYEYIDGWEKFEETTLPPKKAFYSKLSMRGISDEDYAHAIEKRKFINLVINFFLNL